MRTLRKQPEKNSAGRARTPITPSQQPRMHNLNQHGETGVPAVHTESRYYKKARKRACADDCYVARRWVAVSSQGLCSAAL